MTGEIPKLRTGLEIRIADVAERAGVSEDEVWEIYDQMTDYEGFSWHSLSREQKDVLMENVGRCAYFYIMTSD